MKLKHISGFDRISVDDTVYEWSPLLNEYRSPADRTLQANDISTLTLNTKPIAVSDAVSIGWAFYGISDCNWSGRDPQEHEAFLKRMGKALNVSEWRGELAACSGSGRVVKEVIL